MTQATEPRAARVNAASSRLVNYPSVSALGTFLGTAAEHLEAVERQIDEARAAHRPVADLLKRQRILKARCAALGGFQQ